MLTGLGIFGPPQGWMTAGNFGPRLARTATSPRPAYAIN